MHTDCMIWSICLLLGFGACFAVLVAKLSSAMQLIMEQGTAM